MANHRATQDQFLAARKSLVSEKQWGNDKYVKHLITVWHDAPGPEKAALLQRTQTALTERFGLEDGARKFADAMKVGA